MPATSTALSLLLIAVLIVSYCINYVIRRYRFTLVPESAATIIVGLLCGLVIHFTSSIQGFGEFNPDTFFIILLPPIIFESGFNIHERKFFSNFASIMTFAVFGTIISTFTVAVIAWSASQSSALSSSSLTFLEALIFGALISATDPVSTLSIFERVDADPTLYSLVFGESVMNDAVAIVLFQTMVNFVSSPFTVGAVFAAIGEFIGIFLGSLLIGFLMGIILSFVLKKTQVRNHPSMEVASLILMAYASYLVADVAYCSGVVAIFFFGTTQRHYTWYNLSAEAKAGAMLTLRTLAELSETAIFGYLGLSVFNFSQTYSAGLSIIAFLACLVGRAFNVFPLSLALNAKRSRENRITPRMQVALWNSGLRGAVAYALSLRIPTSNRPILVGVTHVIVFFTVLVVGATTKPVLEGCYGVCGKKKQEREMFSVELGEPLLEEVPHASVPYVEAAGSDMGGGTRGRRSYTGIVLFAKKFDSMYLVPLVSRRFDLAMPLSGMADSGVLSEGMIDSQNSLDGSMSMQPPARARETSMADSVMRLNNVEFPSTLAAAAGPASIDAPYRPPPANPAPLSPSAIDGTDL